MTKAEQLYSGESEQARTALFHQITSTKPRYVMIGGFLGAGKTTTVLELARFLNDQEIRVGLITNDQGTNLVDTAMLLANGFMVEEVTGGCFCCKFNSLIEAAKSLVAANVPNVFIAEPVGSCTDLLASVYYPLQKMYGENFIIAPLTVVIDPVRARRVFGLAPGNQLSEKVIYIYKKQLEEAEVVLINKTDLVTQIELKNLRAKLQSDFPDAEIFEVSARNKSGLQPWFDRILKGEGTKKSPIDVDYELYGEGEILLGWLNSIVSLKNEKGFDGNDYLTRFATGLTNELKNAKAQIGHLKLTLDPGTGLGDMGIANIVRNDIVPELSQQLSEEVFEGEMIINIRAETNPETLEKAVRTVSQQMTVNLPGVLLKIENLEAFRPGKPQRSVESQRP